MALTREEILKVYVAGPEAVVALVEQLLAHIARQDEQIHALTARVAALEARLAKDSHNSSKPPASDGLAKKTKSLRQSTGRPPGGQPGHPGATLELTPTPDQVEEHAPLTCQGCGVSLALVPGVVGERRQVYDLPPLRLLVTEHQAIDKCCPHCQTHTGGRFPATVTQPVQYGPQVKAVAIYLQQYQLLPSARTVELLGDLFGCSLCEGTLLTATERCAARLEPVEAAIRAALIRASVGHFDETGMRIGARLHWLHQAGTPTLTYYAVHPKRGKAAIDAIGILPAFQGTAVHDGWAAYASYDCRHALCNAHHLRELTFVAEQGDQPWAAALIALLLEGKAAVAAAVAAGASALVPEVRAELFHRYTTLVEAGRAANPPPEPTGKRGRRKQSPAKNLVDRLARYQESVLAYLVDFAVPFDNNLAERDLRMMKVRQKVSGSFRTEAGAAAFCRIRGYISTLRKQGLAVLPALTRVFEGHPLVPSLSPE